MQRNVGGHDRAARIVLGVLFVVASIATVAFVEGLGEGTKLLVAAGALPLGAILLATAGAETCPFNGLLGRDTYERESRL